MPKLLATATRSSPRVLAEPPGARYGEEREVACGWCGDRITATWRRYDHADAGYWDQRRHACGITLARFRR